MHDTLSNTGLRGAGNSSYASDSQIISASRLAAIAARVNDAVNLARNANATVGANLDRLLGATPEAITGAGAEQPRNSGALGELDDICSALICALEYTNNLASRLSQV